MDNQEIINKTLDGMGINVLKGEAGLVEPNFGGILPKKFIEQIESLSRSQGGWLGNVTTKTRASAAGSYPIMEISEPVTEFVGKNSATRVTSDIPTREVEYNCKKAKSEFVIPWEDVAQAAANGMPDLEQRIIAEFQTARDNDVANFVINGDTSLDDSTRLNRLLRGVDGVLKQLRTATGSNVTNNGGKSYVGGVGIFTAMMMSLPERFRQDPNLEWLINDTVEALWLLGLTNTNTTEKMRSNLGDSIVAEGRKVNPLGKRLNIVPHIKATMGATPIAPTSAATSGNGIKVILTTLLPAAIDSTGRRVKVIFKTTGATETCVVWRDSGTNAITTTGKLGQATVSTNASDYLVTASDQTSLIHGNPKNIHLIYWDQMRAYRKFNIDRDRYEFTFYYQADVKVPTPETMVLFDEVTVIPPVTW